MNPESHIRKRLISLMAKHHAVAIEDACGPGVPDVNFCDGWIELKQVAEPKRPTTIVRVPTFSPAQRHWIATRCRAALEQGTGTGAWVLIRIGRRFYLLAGLWAAEKLGSVTLPEIEGAALAVGGLPDIVAFFAD